MCGCWTLPLGWSGGWKTFVEAGPILRAPVEVGGLFAYHMIYGALYGFVYYPFKCRTSAISSMISIMALTWFGVQCTNSMLRKSQSWVEGSNRENRTLLSKVGSPCGGFLKWWYPTTMGFPTKNDQFGVFWGYQNLRKHPYDDEPSCTNTQSQFVFFPMWASCPLPTLICQPHVVIYWLLLICLMCESNLTLFLFWTLSGHLLCSIYASRD